MMSKDYLFVPYTFICDGCGKTQEAEKTPLGWYSRVIEYGPIFAELKGTSTTMEHLCPDCHTIKDIIE